MLFLLFKELLPGLGPGLSAFNKNIVLVDNYGINASINIRNTIPPIQWVKLLQNNIPLGSDSISVNIEAPVVVKPDDVSKNASINEGIAPLITKGSAPTTEINIHANPTVRNPSFAYISSLSVLILHKKIIIGNISTIVIKNDNASPSP